MRTPNTPLRSVKYRALSNRRICTVFTPALTPAPGARGSSNEFRPPWQVHAAIDAAPRARFSTASQSGQPRRHGREFKIPNHVNFPVPINKSSKTQAQAALQPQPPSVSPEPPEETPQSTTPFRTTQSDVERQKEGDAAAERARQDTRARLRGDYSRIDPALAAMDRDLQETYARAQILRRQMYSADAHTKQALDRQHADLVTKADQLKSKVEELRKRKAELNVLIERTKNP